jgi:hypothetical protein
VTKGTLNRGRLSSFGHSLSHSSHKSSGTQVWRRREAAATTTRFLVLVSGLWTLCLVRYSWRERHTLSLGYLLGLVLLPELFYLSRLQCSGVAICLWLGDNIEILSMVKRAH